MPKVTTPMRQPSARTLAKAASLAVVRATNGSYRVGGSVNVHTIYFSQMQKTWVCDCQASVHGAVCACVIAVIWAEEKRNGTT